MLPVLLIHLLEEDKRQHGMRAETGVIWREALPQRKESLFTDRTEDHILAKQDDKLDIKLKKYLL